MKKFIFIFALLLLIPFYSILSQDMIDVVHLKNGDILKGLIIENVPNDYVRIELPGGSLYTVHYTDILELTKEKKPIEGKSDNQETLQIDNDTEEPAKDFKTVETRGEKSPLLAFGLSFLIPGLGQYYNGDYVKGAIQTGLYVTGWVLYFTLGWESVSDYSASWDPYWEQYDYYYYYYDQETAWLYVGLGIAAASAIWSMIDAPISASNINDRIQRSRYGHLFEINQGENVLGIDFGVTRKGLGTSITYHF